jgi:dGTPase
VCTRVEHVLYVASISSTICRGLSLNNDLIRAISLGHDLGHTPFGHVGESALSEALKKRGLVEGFKHEIHGLRVIDRAANFGKGLNLTYEVRDGILNHCGESYDRVLRPDRARDLSRLSEITTREFFPATLEGCLVRMVDRISYLGRDLEDALKNNMIRREDIPKEVTEKIGIENGNIIGYFVNDIIMHSVGEDKIELGQEAFDLMLLMRDFNYKNIYHNDFENKKSSRAKTVIELLFQEFEEAFEYSNNGMDYIAREKLINNISIMKPFFKFIDDMNYEEGTTALRIVTDYIAGMTDCFAEQTFKSLFLPETF